MDVLSKAYDLFIREASQKFTADEQKEKIRQEKIEQQKKVLLPIRNLFNRFIELGLLVKADLNYDPSKKMLKEREKTEILENVFFAFYKEIKDDKIYLIVQHPVMISISVESVKEQTINIYVTGNCPFVELIKNKKFNIETGTNSLAKFFAKNAVKLLHQN